MLTEFSAAFEPCLRSGSSHSISRSKPRARLTEAQVVEIFQAKQNQKGAATVARLYGINEKTVRDVWSGRTWSKETWHLDILRPVSFKQIGRPRGSRDTKQRKSRALVHQPERGESAFNEHSQGAMQDSLRKHADCSPDETALQTCGKGKQTQAGVFQKCQGGNRYISIDDQLYEWDRQGFWIDLIIDALKN